MKWHEHYVTYKYTLTPNRSIDLARSLFFLLAFGTGCATSHGSTPKQRYYTLSLYVLAESWNLCQPGSMLGRWWTLTDLTARWMESATSSRWCCRFDRHDRRLRHLMVEMGARKGAGKQLASLLRWKIKSLGNRTVGRGLFKIMNMGSGCFTMAMLWKRWAPGGWTLVLECNYLQFSSLAHHGITRIPPRGFKRCQHVLMILARFLKHTWLNCICNFCFHLAWRSHVEFGMFPTPKHWQRKDQVLRFRPCSARLYFTGASPLGRNAQCRSRGPAKGHGSDINIAVLYKMSSM